MQGDVRGTVVIRAGRAAWVQNSAGLAAAMGLKIGSFRNQRPWEQEGFPAVISPAEARAKLWDGEQTAAFLAGRPVPALPDADSDEDLLERTEAADFLKVSPKTWDAYKKDPRIAPHLMIVAGVEHCPRGVLRAFRTMPAPAASARPAHRPRGSGDMVPRDELPARVAALLDADPGLTIAGVQDVLGIAYVTAARMLTRLRGERIAALLAADADLTARQAAQRLGYPTAVHRAAIAYARTEVRARAIRPYLQGVVDVLVAERLAEPQEITTVQVREDVLAAAVVLSSTAPAAALVWDERWGWRTAASRRHPLGRESGSPPQGEAIRFLSPHQQPTAREILDALFDGRRGSSRPMQRRLEERPNN